MEQNVTERMLGDMRGRVALVTGASSGIGAATVRRFLQGGAKVYGVARRASMLEEVGGEWLESGMYVPCAIDVTDSGAVDELIASIGKTEAIDTVVLAAGTNVTERQFEDLTHATFDDLVKVNLSGVFYVFRAVLPHLRAKAGDAVLISSVAALWPDHSGPAYQATKAALIGLARGASRDEHSHGVRVTSVLPGAVNTEILDKRPVPPTQELRQLFIQPEDVAESVLAAVTLPNRTTVSEITLTATRLQSIGNTHEANPSLPL